MTDTKQTRKTRNAHNPRVANSPYASRLETLREAAHYSQRFLAHLLNVDQSTISRAQDDRRVLGMDKWRELAEFLGVDVEYLRGVA